MPNKIAQFNVRLPKETVHAITVIAAMLDVPVQQLGADAIAIYYGKADEETLERRRVIVSTATAARFRCPRAPAIITGSR